MGEMLEGNSSSPSVSPHVVWDVDSHYSFIDMIADMYLEVVIIQKCEWRGDPFF